MSSFRFETLESPKTHDSRWLYHPRPHPNESLTSLLNRTAIEFGVSLRAVLKKLDCPQLGTINHDFDLEIPYAMRRHLRQSLGLTDEEIEATTLGSSLMSISVRRNPRILDDDCYPLHSTWVLPTFRLHQRLPYARHGIGTPFCPQCVLESSAPWCNKNHRYSFVFFCSQHKAPLIDVCPACGAGASALSIKIKPGDGFDLRRFRCQFCDKNEESTLVPQIYALAERRVPSRVIQIQEAALLALETGKIYLAGIGWVSAAKFFAGMRRLLPACLVPFRNGYPCPPYLRRESRERVPSNLSESPPHFEFSNFEDRLARFNWVAWVVRKPRERWGIFQELCWADDRFPIWWRHPWDGLDDQGNSENIRPEAWKAPANRVLPGDLKRFFRIVSALGLQPHEVRHLIGHATAFDIKRWQADPKSFVPHKNRNRVEHFLSLWDQVASSSPDLSAGLEWFNSPNPTPPLHGMTPLEFLRREPGALPVELLSDQFAEATEQSLHRVRQ